MVIGCGYLGERVAARWKQGGDDVLVATRSRERADRFQALGYDVRILDITEPDTLSDLPPLDMLLMAVAYDSAAPVSRARLHVDGLANVLNSIKVLTGPLIYISTTGVYGQRDDSWVDEQSACEPEREVGKIYLRAERLLRSHRWGQQTVILRLAGIYGPNRVPFLDRLRTGQPIRVDTAGYLNLIHVDDASRVVLACEQCSLPNLYVVSDGQPVVRRVYYEEVGSRVGRSPDFDEPDSSGHQSQRALTSKRICNRKLLKDLEFRFEFPSYREGISAILGS